MSPSAQMTEESGSEPSRSGRTFANIRVRGKNEARISLTLAQLLAILRAMRAACRTVALLRAALSTRRDLLLESPRARRENVIARLAEAFAEPCAQARHHWRRERSDSLLPPLAHAKDVWTDAQMNVGGPQPNELRHAESRLDCEGE